MRKKFLDGKSCYSSPFLPINIFANGNFPKHSTERFPYEVFHSCETKQFRRRIVIPALLIIPVFSRYPKSMKHLKIFGIVRQKKYDGKSWYSPPFLIDKLFRHWKVSATQHRKIPLRSFSVLWEKKSRKNCDITLLGRKFLNNRS